MPTSLNIALKNNTSSQNVYAHITGQAIANNYAPMFLEADGVTPYYPASPSQTLQPLAVDCAIAIGAPGSTRTVTVPQLSGARIWLCRDTPLTFLLNPGPGIVEPSSTNPSDPNYNLDWGFCEFTLNDAQVFVNVSYVDFVSLSISVQLENTSGVVTSVQAIPPGGLDTVCTKLQQQDAADGAGWGKLVIRNSANTANLRALSPNSGITLFPGLFDGYYQSYVDAVWSKYSTTPLTVDTQYTWGTVTGTVASDNTLTFAGVGSFAQPAAADIFSCSTGPFGNYTSNADEMANIGARLAAAFNRSTLLVDSVQPDDETVAEYYAAPVTNHYSRICHETETDGRGYAFPYDDVGPAGGSDQSGSLFDPNPSLLTVNVG